MTSNDWYPDNHNGLRIKTLKPIKLIQNCAIVIKENTKSCEKDWLTLDDYESIISTTNQKQAKVSRRQIWFTL